MAGSTKERDVSSGESNKSNGQLDLSKANIQESSEERDPTILLPNQSEDISSLDIGVVSTQESKLRSLVEEFKKSCERKNFRIYRDPYFYLVKRLAEAKQFDMIEEVIEHQKKFPNIHREGFGIRLITLYGESGMFEHARKLFHELPALGCRRTVKSFNALLNSAIAAKEFQRVLELFKDLPSEVSIEPDVISHNTVVHALCEMGCFDEALLKFRELGIKVDTVTYNTLLFALYKHDRFSEAEKLWAEMEESENDVEPDKMSYDMRIKAMFSKNKVNEAVRLAAEMANKGIKYDNYIYSNMIMGLCKNGDLKEAKKWYNDLQKSKCDIRHFGNTYFGLISACCEAADFDMAFEICSDVVKHKIFINSTRCKQIIDKFMDNGRTEEALELKNCLRL